MQKITDSKLRLLYPGVIILFMYGSVFGQELWESTADIPDATDAVLDIAANADGALYVLVGSNAGLQQIFRSPDNGNTWQKVDTEQDMGRTFGIEVGNNGLLWLASDSGVFRSSEGGSSMEKLDNGLPENGSVWNIRIGANGAAAVIQGEEIYATVDNGDSWEFVAETLMPFGLLYVDSEGRVYNESVEGIIRHTYNSAENSYDSRWITSSEGISHYVEKVSGDASGVLVVSSSNGIGDQTEKIYSSLNGGESWEQLLEVDAPQDPLEVTGLFAIDATGILAATQSQGVLYSADAGATWSEFNSGLPTGAVISTFCKGAGNRVFAGSNSEARVFYTGGGSVSVAHRHSAASRVISAVPSVFNRSTGTAIEYTLPNTARVKVSVYSSNGQEITVLADHIQPSGTQRIFWNGASNNGQVIATGMYFVQLFVASEPLASTAIMYLP